MDSLAAKGEKLPPLGGVPVGIKDVMVTRGRAHHGRLEDSGQLYSTVRLHGGGSDGSCRRGGFGQIELRRVCHGIVERKFGMAAGSQSPRSEPRARGFLGRIGGSGGGGHGGGNARIRHRRLDPPTRVVLRSGRPDADLWTSVALWIDCVRVVARSHRPADQNRERCRHRAADDCRPRSDGFNFRRRAGSRLCCGTGEAGARTEARRGKGIFRRGSGL